MLSGATFSVLSSGETDKGGASSADLVTGFRCAIPSPEGVEPNCEEAETDCEEAEIDCEKAEPDCEEAGPDCPSDERLGTEVDWNCPSHKARTRVR